MKMLTRLIGAEDVQLKTILPTKVEASGRSPGQMEQILMNLAVGSRCDAAGRQADHQTADAVFDEDYVRHRMSVHPVLM